MKVHNFLLTFTKVDILLANLCKSYDILFESPFLTSDILPVKWNFVMILQSCTYACCFVQDNRRMYGEIQGFLRLVAINLVGMRSKHLWHISWNSSHKVLSYS